MTLTLELPPELETQLREAAARRGQDPATFATLTLAHTLRDANPTASLTEPNTGKLDAEAAPILSPEEFDAALDELAPEGAVRASSDNLETYSRDRIYLDSD